jgi:hypothetical protein
LTSAQNIRETYETSRFGSRGTSPTEALEKLQELEVRLQQVLADFAVNDEIRKAEEAAKQALEELVAREYATCPVCGEDVEESRYHYCNEQDALRAKGQYKDFVLKQTTQVEDENISLVAKYDDKYNEYEIHLKVDRKVKFNPEIAETKSHWREPSKRERELMKKIEDVKYDLRKFDWEREHGRIEVVFSEETKHRGNTQFQSKEHFTGSVSNNKAENGLSYYENQEVLFVANLNSDVRLGESWFCTIGFQISEKNGMPIIVLNPQSRSDGEAELREKLAKLEAELANLDSEEELKSDETENGLKIITSEVPNAMEQALIKAGLAVHKPSSK